MERKLNFSKISLLVTAIFCFVEACSQEQGSLSVYEKYFDIHNKHEVYAPILNQLSLGQAISLGIRQEDFEKFAALCSEKAYAFYRAETLKLLTQLFTVDQMIDIVVFYESAIGQFVLENLDRCSEPAKKLMQILPQIGQEVADSLAVKSIGIIDSSSTRVHEAPSVYEKCFDITNNNSQFALVLKRQFASYAGYFSIKNEDVEEFANICAERAYVIYRAEYIALLEQMTTIDQMVEILAFYDSSAGQVMLANQDKLLDLSINLVRSIPEIGQQVATLFVTASKETEKEGSSVIAFESLLEENFTESQVIEKFNDVVSKDIVVVKFSATWCPPCKIYEPAFKFVAKEVSNVGGLTVKYITVDAESCPEILQMTTIRMLPTTLFYKNGNIVKRETGVISKANLIKFIDDIA